MTSAQEILEWYVGAGIDVCLNDTPVNRFEEITAKPQAAIGSPVPASKPVSQAVRDRLAKPAPPPEAIKQVTETHILPDGQAAQSARDAAASANTLDELKEVMTGFNGCNLKRTAKNLVFADGNPNASVMIVGEAPDRDEDIQGIPFVNQTGLLLDRMLAAINLDRESAYLTNVIPWRPPGNRAPTPGETEICRPFIERHIELVNPNILVLMGGLSANILLKKEGKIIRLRGNWNEVSIGEKSYRAMPTLHPGFLLEQQEQKRLAWKDLLKIADEIG